MIDSVVPTVIGWRSRTAASSTSSRGIVGGKVEADERESDNLKVAKCSVTPWWASPYAARHDSVIETNSEGSLRIP